MNIPNNHPRAESLRMRENIIQGMHGNIVAEAGLIAHGRGEAFDYLLGESTPEFAIQQQEVALAMLLTAESPVLSVNGNVAVLCTHELIEFSELLSAPLEVNLFYRREERAPLVAKVLEDAGAKNILGIDPEFNTTIPELSHSRRTVDKRGIYGADVVFVPLEDGDRTMTLRKMGKSVITIDLNPLSRTSLWSNVTIVNNVARAIPEMISMVKKLKKLDQKSLIDIVKNFDNNLSLQNSLEFISRRLMNLTKTRLQRGFK